MLFLQRQGTMFSCFTSPLADARLLRWHSQKRQMPLGTIKITNRKFRLILFWNKHMEKHSCIISFEVNLEPRGSHIFPPLILLMSLPWDFLELKDTTLCHDSEAGNSGGLGPSVMIYLFCRIVEWNQGLHVLYRYLIIELCPQARPNLLIFQRSRSRA